MPSEMAEVVFEMVFHFFQALERFLYEAMSLLSKLEEIQEGLSKNEFAETLDGLKDQIKKNQHVKKWIVKAPVEVLEQEGEKILDSIRNPGNGEESEGFSTEDFKSAEQQIKGLMENLHGKRKKLRELWNIRKMQLEQSFQFRVFEQDAEKVCHNFMVFGFFFFFTLEVIN